MKACYLREQNEGKKHTYTESKGKVLTTNSRARSDIVIMVEV